MVRYDGVYVKPYRIIAFCSIAASLLYWMLTPEALLSGDAYAYVSTAQNLVEGNSFARANGKPFVAWPPLYPTLLAAGLSLGLSASATAKLYSTLGVGITVGVMLWVLWLMYSSPRSTGSAWSKNSSSVILFWIVSLGLVLLVFSPRFVRTIHVVYSESIFIPLTLATLLIAGLWLTQPKPFLLSLAFALASLCVLMRYVGVALVLTVAVVSLLPTANNDQNTLSWKQLLRAGCYTVAAVLPILGWMLWNHLRHRHPHRRANPLPLLTLSQRGARRFRVGNVCRNPDGFVPGNRAHVVPSGTACNRLLGPGCLLPRSTRDTQACQHTGPVRLVHSLLRIGVDECNDSLCQQPGVASIYGPSPSNRSSDFRWMFVMGQHVRL